MPKKIDETGNKYTYLRVLCESSQRKDGKVCWWCWCTNCNTIVVVSGKKLRSGHTKSCGCLQREKVRSRYIYGPNSLVGPKHILLKERTGKDGKAIFQCPRCNKDWIADVHNVVKGNSTQCPDCARNQKISQGEQLVQSLLDKLNISYVTQYQFEDCVNPKTGFRLSFDFFLPSYNCCIEYDGIQHFKKEGTWNRYNENSLEQVQYRDTVKNEYCEINNIHLVRIPYTDKSKLNEEYILNKLEEKCQHI